MHPLLTYPIHLAWLAAGVIILHLMARRSASAQAQMTVAAVAGLVLVGLLLHVSEPPWERLFSDFYKAYFAAGQALLFPPHGQVWMPYFVRLPLSTFFVGGMLLLFVLLRARWKLADVPSLPLPDSCAASVK